MGHHHRRDLVSRRRRVEDEGDEEGAQDIGGLDDDSLTEGSIISDEEEAPEGEETVDGDTANPESSEKAKVNGSSSNQPANAEKTSSNATGPSKSSLTNGTTETDMMLNGINLPDATSEAVNFEDFQENDTAYTPSPAIVTSTAQMDRPQELPHERRRREHEEYKKRRDADPAFVPNRGAFFMHDHRHAGPAANGFRPFGRGRGGRGRPGIGGPYAPLQYIIITPPKRFCCNNNMLTDYSQAAPPLEPTDAPWAHDMHDVITEQEPTPTSNGVQKGPATAPKSAPLNRSLSTTKLLGNVQIRVFFGDMEKPVAFPGIPMKQYTRLPDHRPPLRRDKPVRISLPDHPPRYIFPAVDRSFIFIPRAMRPNQQGFGGRGRGRAGLGSVGGYSRRTSVFGGSIYDSTYSPSVAMSRRSSLAREVNRDPIVSPSGSAMSRPQIAMDTSKPVVKLPPSSQSAQPQVAAPEPEMANGSSQAATSLETLPRPQTYPLPQKPTLRENRPNQIPMHQPRPQKTVSVADIESPASMSFNPPQQTQQPFHQQVPIQVNGNNYSHDNMPHSRQPSYPSQASTGTPLSQIPERAIHAPAFQPNPYQQPAPTYYPQTYPVLQAPQGYYYPQTYNPTMASTAGAAPFVPAQPPAQQTYTQPAQQPADASTSQAQAPQSLVAQEVNGMVYYYDAAQIPTVPTYPAYQPPPQYPMQQVGGVVGIGGMMTPSPDGFYYPQQQGIVYYAQ
ncbi:CASC3 Barentsz domain-containing protein [Rutstroemia sp. NJR-2017a BVV2]|nr:CASC3 Barentsz domain-containing protein [Rutstroemia sp. NJR-2017a BVV2]